MQFQKKDEKGPGVLASRSTDIVRSQNQNGLEIEPLLQHVPGSTDIVTDRIVGKPYLQFEIDRDRIARYGVNIRDVQDVIEIAIGGMNIMESDFHRADTFLHH